MSETSRSVIEVSGPGPTGRSASPPLRVVPLLVAALVASPSAARAQDIPVDALGIARFGSEAGMPGLYVPDMAVTGDGLLWLIVSGRLAAFDGFVFEDVELGAAAGPDPQGLTGLGPGRADTLWVTVGRRLLARADGRFRVRATHDQVLRDAWQEDDGSLWAWDDGGVLLLVGDRFERVASLRAGWNWGLLEDPPEVGLPGGDVRLVDSWNGSVRWIKDHWVLQPTGFPERWPVTGPPGRVLVTRRWPEHVEVTRPSGEPVARYPASPERTTLLLDRRGVLWTARPGAVDAYASDGTLVASLGNNILAVPTHPW